MDGRSTVRVTCEPASPLIWPVASSESVPAIDLPSTSVTMSPSWMPASLAGESLKTVATRRPCLTSLTVSPTPEKRPEVRDWNSLNWSGLK